jgi:hypothetical protein
MAKTSWTLDGKMMTRILPGGWTAHIQQGTWAYGWIVQRAENEMSVGADVSYRSAQLAVARAHKRLQRLARMAARETAKKTSKPARKAA